MKKLKKRHSSNLAYIARYSPDASGTNLKETVLFVDMYWSPRMGNEWDKLMLARKPGDNQLQAWCFNTSQTTLIAETPQPFSLD